MFAALLGHDIGGRRAQQRGPDQKRHAGRPDHDGLFGQVGDGARGIARGSRRVRPDNQPMTNGFAKAAATRRRPAGAPAQFKDEAGNTWSGRGRRPEWLKDALRSGKTLDDLRS